ncbi:MAG: hypothetical protein ACTSVY_08025 [Candidatus Helarchaeota archaeon]
MPFTPEEIENMHSMLRRSIEDLHHEKSNAGQKWINKLKKFNCIVNFEITGPDFKESAGFLNAYFEKGKLTVNEGRSDKATIEFKAPLMNYFQFSSNEISLLSALLSKLKIKGKRYLRTLMTIASILRVIPESKFNK